MDKVVAEIMDFLGTRIDGFFLDKVDIERIERKGEPDGWRVIINVEPIPDDPKKQVNERGILEECD